VAKPKSKVKYEADSDDEYLYVEDAEAQSQRMIAVEAGLLTPPGERLYQTQLSNGQQLFKSAKQKKSMNIYDKSSSKEGKESLEYLSPCGSCQIKFRSI
jgi:hypothetical protein